MTQVIESPAVTVELTPLSGGCRHLTPCPSADSVDRDAARSIATFREQGWSLLCNGVILFEDTGEILPDGTAVEPHRGPARHALAA